MFNVAVRLPVADGVNVSRIVQEELAAIEPALTHVPPLRAKLVGFVPVMVKKGVAKTSAAVPVFDTVTVKGALVLPWSWFPKAAGLGDRPMTGSVPVPVRASEPFAVPDIFKVPVRLPVPAGVKVRMTVQVPETAIVAPLAQVPPVRAKSVELAPVSVKNGVLSTSEAVPIFDTVMVSGAVVVPCS